MNIPMTPVVGGPGFDPRAEHERQKRAQVAIERIKRAVTAMDAASVLGVVAPEEYETAAALLASIARRASSAWCELVETEYETSAAELARGTY